MARQPENIHVYLYRKNADQQFEYAIFQRSDHPIWWQGISGGVEEGETVEQAAWRESFEEAGTPLNIPLYRLETMSYLPADIFPSCSLWGEDAIVCPLFFFAMPYDGDVVLSGEHIEVRWLTYKEAESLVYFHDQKTALWELNQRLLKDKLLRAV